MRLRVSIAIGIGLIAAALIYAGMIFFDMRANTVQEKRGMFSWKSDVFTDGGEELFSFMKQHGFTELYQWFSSELGESDTTLFLTNAAREKIDIYLLTGDPSWAIDSEGKKNLEATEKAHQLNKLVPHGGLKGIVFDTEPYLLDNWELNSDEIFESYLSGMKKAYSKAASYNLEVITCIPYDYENIFSRDGLKALIRTACDRVAVMNYIRDGEVEAIENEAVYAGDYGKQLINIYEFKPVGDMGVEEINTYNTAGLNSALENFAELERTYPDCGITMAAHDYEALREVLKQNG